MSYFVLVYDRLRSRPYVREFGEHERDEAEAFLLERQREAFHKHLDQEVILFQAASLDALKHSHGSYFLTDRQLIERLREAADAAMTDREAAATS